MKLISQALFNPKSSTILVSDNHHAVATGEHGDPESIRTASDIKRVPANELELTYRNNPVVFNSINKVVQTIMSAKHSIKAVDPRVQAYFDKFINELGNSGSDITWEELLTAIFKYQCIYGGAWIENIFNVKGNRIVDWDIIDPKKMDYAKNNSQNVIFDKFGSAIGYTQTLPSYVSIPPEKVAKKPPMVSLPQNSFFIPPEKIAFIKLYTVGDGVYPIGLIEPIYKTSLRKMNMEEALATAIYRHGFPIIWAKLGDLNHEPTPQQVQTMLTKLKDINFKQEIATPFYYDLQILESKKAEKLQGYLDYYNDQEIAGLGIPKPYATGGGEDTNRATLDNQSNLFELTLKDIIDTTTAAIRRYMFKPLCELEGFKEVPIIDWDIVGVDERDKKANRIMDYVKVGILDPKDPRIQEFIKSVEGLD